VADFEALLYRFERNISILGRSKSTFENYARHLVAIALHYGQIPIFTRVLALGLHKRSLTNCKLTLGDCQNESNHKS
jgi:hypothetical protein